MRRHVITPLRIMPIQAPLLVLGNHPVQRIAHVGAHILVPVLVQGQRARGVLDEEVQEADFVRGDFGDGVEDVIGYEVGAAGGGGESELFLGPAVR